MNKIIVNNAKVVYASKKLITTKDDKELALLEYFVQDSVGSWKQNLLVKIFSSDLNTEPLALGSRINFKGVLKLNSYKDSVSEEYVVKTEIIVDKIEDIKVKTVFNSESK
jgi:hypothetical protein